jgi:hypothetical protein
MVTARERRVAALEKSAGGGGDGCGDCGGGGEDDQDGPFKVYFEDERPDDLEENCPQCGRELVTTIYFDDDPNAPWNKREAARPW